MTIDQTLSRYSSHPVPRETAGEILHHAVTAASESDFLPAALRRVAQAAAAECVFVARGTRGRWRLLASYGPDFDLPIELLAETLDEGRSQSNGGWSAAPLVHRSDDGELLAIRWPSAPPAEREPLTDGLAALIGTAVADVRNREQDRRRVERLEAILEIAAQWRQTLEMDSLLQTMAEASTRLLKSERASIFLWDRPNKTLVGRPALGVAGGELRIPDDKGIVGQVVHTGETRRVDVDLGQEEIDRSTDKKLDFHTRSLLCAPLRGTNGELFGAFEMINKLDGNFSDDDEEALVELAGHAAVALQGTQQYAQLLKSRNQMAQQAAEGVRMIGDCAKVEAMRSTISRVANTDLAVLILGENGTGKEVVSQRIHYLSVRRNEPFVAVNCAAIPENLLESELFGHEKGAFTDARDMRVGKFELASGGTIFLDEIGDMSLGGQAKLLRVLEEKVVVRVGGSTPIHTDARVLAATNQDLADMVRDKRFREDLYFRLNVVTLELPPLRERGDDILLLAEHFLRDFCAKARRTVPQFTEAARKRLLSHGWPGNVRELRNLMERVAYLSVGDELDTDELAFTLSPRHEDTPTVPLDLPLAAATNRFQADYITRHIDLSRGNITDAARSLGLHRSNLYRKMKSLGMHASDDDKAERLTESGATSPVDQLRERTGNDCGS